MAKYVRADIRDIEVGQVCRSRDRRDAGRTVTVESWDGDPYGFVTVRSGRKSRIRARNFVQQYELRTSPDGLHSPAGSSCADIRVLPGSDTVGVDSEPASTRPLEGGGLTPEEAEVARRWFAGQATDEELRDVIGTHIQRLVEAGAATSTETAPEEGDRG